MRKIIIFILITVQILSSCQKENATSITASVSSIDLGTLQAAKTYSFVLRKFGDGIASYTLKTDKNWINFSKVSGDISTEEIITFTVNANFFTARDNFDVITVHATADGIEQNPIYIKVVGSFEAGTLVLPEKYDFGIVQESDNPTGSFTIGTTGEGTFSYTLSSDKDWLTFSKTEGTISSKGSDILSFTINDKLKLGNEQNTALVTLIPKTNGVLGKSLTIPILLNFNKRNFNNYVVQNTTETWSGTLNLRGLVTVPTGKTLIIKPGTFINVDKTNTSEIKVEGSLLMNGESSNVIEFKSTAASPTSSDWRGITVFGKVEASYVLFRHAEVGLSVKNSFIAAPKINYCFFADCFVGIFYFGDKISKFSNNSFTGYNFAINYQAKTLEQDTIENCEFFTPKASDIWFLATGISCKILRSNFRTKESTSLSHTEANTDTANVNVTADGCYNLTKATGFGINGNNFWQINPSGTAISGIGCGFTNRY